MEGVMKYDSRRKILVEESSYQLTQDLHDSYPPEVPAEIWNMDHRLPGKILFQITICENPPGTGIKPYANTLFPGRPPYSLPGYTRGGAPPLCLTVPPRCSGKSIAPPRPPLHC